jgi:hypothetical protein
MGEGQGEGERWQVESSDGYPLFLTFSRQGRRDPEAHCITSAEWDCLVLCFLPSTIAQSALSDRLLLCDAMDRSQAPNQIGTGNANNTARGK